MPTKKREKGDTKPILVYNNPKEYHNLLKERILKQYDQFMYNNVIDFNKDNSYMASIVPMTPGPQLESTKAAIKFK